MVQDSEYPKLLMRNVRSEMKLPYSTATNKVGRLCAHSSVNMFSRYKPLHLSRLGEIFDRNTTDWTKGENLTYGIYIPQVTPQNCNTSNWIYERPRGSSSSQYRLKDFVGYNHNARKVTEFWPTLKMEVGAPQPYTFTLNCNAGTTYNIGYDDIFRHQDMYFCIIFKNRKDSYEYIVRSAPQPIKTTNNLAFDIEVDDWAIRWLGVGTHEVTYCFSDKPITSWHEYSLPANTRLYSGYSDGTTHHTYEVVISNYVSPNDFQFTGYVQEAEILNMRKDYLYLNVRFSHNGTTSNTLNFDKCDGYYTSSSGYQHLFVLSNMSPIDTTTGKPAPTITLGVGKSKIIRFTIRPTWADGNGQSISTPSNYADYTLWLNFVCKQWNAAGVPLIDRANVFICNETF